MAPREMWRSIWIFLEGMEKGNFGLAVTLWSIIHTDWFISNNQLLFLFNPRYLFSANNML
jgi:hypothetical protein